MQKNFKARIFAVVCALVLAFSLSANIFAASVNDSKLPVPRYSSPEIKNIIVMIPDGLSSDGYTLTRWYKAYDEKTGEFDTDAMLALDEMSSGLVRTYWTNGKIIGAVTDSAPAATAFATGVKTNDKFVGVTPHSTPVASILEAANLIGKSTGIVVTCNVQHATPAAFTSHYNDRSKYDIIGEQQAYNNIDVMLGGGSMYLVSPYRKDGENIIKELKSTDYEYVTTKEEMNAVKSGKIWGMFAADAMAYDFDIKENAPNEPTLAEMTAKAIELLSQNEEGFFLMVEGSKVDWAAHANDPIGLISDTLAFDAAVKVALDYAKEHQDTMIIAMTDHGNGGITIGNYDTTGSYSSDPLSKFIAPLKKATLTGEGLAAKLNEERTNIAEVMKTYYGIDDLTAEEIEAIKETPASSMNYTVGPMISKRAYLGWTTGGHTGEDVNLYTYLPGDGRITGLIENTDVAKICAKTWNINLNKVTEQLYIDAETVFKANGAAVEIDIEKQAGGRMTVTKDGVILTILENKNYVIVENSILVDSADGPVKVIIESVVVNQSGKFYVPQSVIDLIP